MRKLLLCFSLFLSLHVFAAERILQDRNANLVIPGSNLIRYTDHSTLPNYVGFMKNEGPTVAGFIQWMRKTYRLSSDYGLIELNSIEDGLGFLHIRYKETYKQLPVHGSMLIVHTRNGRVESMSGVVYENIQYGGSGNQLTETAARNAALAKVNASVYKWQVPSEENLLKAEMNDQKATHFPIGEKMFLHYKSQFHLCYAFNVYAQEPLGRTLEYVDVYSGKIILSRNLIETVNVNGTAVTKFSGTQTFQTDSTSATSFRLRDASRGLGVQTLNLNHTSTYGSATDFTDADNYWNNVNANIDEAATDAHWGAQKTYDYLLNLHGRNSIDNAGYMLRSYVHYNTNYVNAFWDGTRMTYGDGNVSQGYFIFTALDVCGHEIGHGLVSGTADLSATSSGSEECDALNEAYADCIGTGVERLGRPTNWDWKIGGDLTCSSAGVPNGIGLRLMSNPIAYGDPKCYQGTNWNTSGEPHANAGPLDYWFYSEAMGNAANNITGLGYNTADSIMYRTLTVHLFPGADYADARFYSILSSTELYGGCSLQTITTTNAWNLCCVGGIYVPGPANANFTADVVQSCDSTLTVNFSNTSTNANSSIWDFGDGSTSTLYNPSHTYSVGVYTVKLFVNGGTCGIDSLINTAFIQVGPPAAPNGVGDTLCLPGVATLTASPNQLGDTVRWYASAVGGTILGTGNTFNTPTISATTTYYAEEKVDAPVYTVGPLNNSIGSGGNYTNTTRFMIFNCTSPTILKTVWVSASSSGNRTIILKNSGGTTLQSVTVNIPNGGSVVTLNMPIPVGNGLQIGLATNSTVNLYRNSTGAAYPYTNGPISITGNSAANSASYYYFFYNWVLQAPPCISQRAPITAVVGSGGGPISASVTPTGPVTSCSNSPFTLTANSGSGYLYQWYQNGSAITGATSASYTATQSGNYYVVISSAAGCLTPGTSNTVVVNISSAPTASITPSGNLNICQGNSITLATTSGSGLTYQWYKGTTMITGANASSYSATTSGTYSVVVSNTAGCSATSSAVNLTVNAQPIATLTPGGSHILCQGNSLNLVANTGSGYTYQWLNGANIIFGANNSNFSATQAGTYAVIITALGGCSDTSSVTTITVVPSPAITVIPQSSTTFCSGSQVLLQADVVVNYNYQWYLNGAIIAGATGNSYLAGTSGNYSVQVSNGNGCPGISNTVTVTVLPLPQAIISCPKTTICVGDSTIITANNSAGNTFVWYRNNNLIPNANSASYTATLAGTYFVKITNSNGCTNTSNNIIITVTPLPTPTIVNTNGTLSVTGGSFTTYQWFLGNIAIGGANSTTYTPTVNGDYSVEVTQNGCTAKASIHFGSVGVNTVLWSDFNISPNPFSNLIHISGEVPEEIRIIDPAGKVVVRTYRQTDIDVSHLSEGIYFIQLYSHQKLLGQKKVIKLN